MGRDAGTTGRWMISSPFQFQSFHDFTSEVCRHIVIPGLVGNAPGHAGPAVLASAAESAPATGERQPVIWRPVRPLYSFGQHANITAAKIQTNAATWFHRNFSCR